MLVWYSKGQGEPRGRNTHHQFCQQYQQGNHQQAIEQEKIFPLKYATILPVKSTRSPNGYTSFVRHDAI